MGLKFKISTSTKADLRDKIRPIMGLKFDINSYLLYLVQDKIRPIMGLKYLTDFKLVQAHSR